MCWDRQWGISGRRVRPLRSTVDIPRSARVLGNGVLASTLAYLSDISITETLSVFYRSSQVYTFIKWRVPQSKLKDLIMRLLISSILVESWFRTLSTASPVLP
ncbi:hypothetical protein Tco_1351263 [Tanacetum coccineum]